MQHYVEGVCLLIGCSTNEEVGHFLVCTEAKVAILAPLTPPFTVKPEDGRLAEQCVTECTFLAAPPAGQVRPRQMGRFWFFWSLESLE